MPIVDHAELRETPWRPNYRKWDISARGDGTTSSNLSISVAGPGAGAPLHKHESDELIVILDGELDVRLGDDVTRVGRDHTLVIPPNVPHGFTVAGERDARMLTFFPVSDPFDHTTFLEGGPPIGTFKFIGSGKPEPSDLDPISEPHDGALAEDFGH